MLIVKSHSKSILLICMLCFLFSCVKGPSEDSFGMNTSKDEIFKFSIVDDSVDSSLMTTFNNSFTLGALEKALLDSKSFFKKNEKLDELLIQMDRMDSTGNAIWRVENKLMCSLQVEQEWHIAINIPALREGKIKVDSIIPISPDAGVE